MLDGKLTFAASHDYARMEDPAVLEIKRRITVIADHELDNPGAMISCKVEVIKKDGTRLSEEASNEGSEKEIPLTAEEVEAKSLELMIPVLGEGRSRELIDAIWSLEKIKNMRDLRPLLSNP